MNGKDWEDQKCLENRKNSNQLGLSISNIVEKVEEKKEFAMMEQRPHLAGSEFNQQSLQQIMNRTKVIMLGYQNHIKYLECQIADMQKERDQSTKDA